MLVPLYLVAGLNNTAAVALSNSTILAGSVGNTLVNVFKRHPYKNKPMVSSGRQQQKQEVVAQGPKSFQFNDHAAR